MSTRTSAQPGTVRVAIYKDRRHGSRPWFVATCDCGWESPGTDELGARSIVQYAFDHLSDCSGSPDIPEMQFKHGRRGTFYRP